jgi:hypothetical protein
LRKRAHNGKRKTENESKRKVTYAYYTKIEKGTDVRVCLHVFNHIFNVGFKIFSSETCQSYDEWLPKDAGDVPYIVRLCQLNTEKAYSVMTDENKISRPFTQKLCSRHCLSKKIPMETIF